MLDHTQALGYSHARTFGGSYLRPFGGVAWITLLAV